MSGILPVRGVVSGVEFGRGRMSGVPVKTKGRTSSMCWCLDTVVQMLASQIVLLLAHVSEGTASHRSTCMYCLCQPLFIGCNLLRKLRRMKTNQIIRKVTRADLLKRILKRI